MSTIKSLAVKHTATYKGDPLVVFSDLPGPDAELMPAQIRKLAAALIIIADDCESHARGVRRAIDRRQTYTVEV